MQDITITIEDIRAAQVGDRKASELVIQAMDSRIMTIARNEARRCGSGAQSFVDDFAQSARIAVWEALPRFTGESVDDFFAFMHRTAATTVKDTSADERNPGADRDAVKSFAYWVRQCGGDLAEAERQSQLHPDAYGRRLGRDRAHAARLAWEHPLSVDMPMPGNNEDVNSASVSLSESLASTLGIPEDLITPEDLSNAQREERTGLVHLALALMGAQTANVLRGTFGIAPMSCYGFDQNDELGASLGMTAKQVINGRAKGYRAFASKYIPMVAGLDDTLAQGWWEAFEAERQKGNASRTRIDAKRATA